MAYVAGAAEALPLVAGYFDLVTVSSAFHWLERERFLAEVRRVLVDAGWLVVYDNFFGAQMEGAPAFNAWIRGMYLSRFPTPPRPRTTFGPDEAARHGFRFAGQELYQNPVVFSAERRVDYLVTQTNVIAAVEGGREPLADVRQWLREGVEPLFADRPEASFPFSGPIWYLQKQTE